MFTTKPSVTCASGFIPSSKQLHHDQHRALVSTVSGLVLRLKMFLRTFTPVEDMPVYSWLLQFQDHPGVVSTLKSFIGKCQPSGENHCDASVIAFLSENKDLFLSRLATSKCDSVIVNDITLLPTPTLSFSKQAYRDIASVIDQPAVIDVKTPQVECVDDESPCVTESRDDSLAVYLAKKEERASEWFIENLLEPTCSIQVSHIPEIVLNEVSHDYFEPMWIKLRKSRAYPIVIYMPGLYSFDDFKSHLAIPCMTNSDVFVDGGMKVLVTDIASVLKYSLLSYAIIPDPETFASRSVRGEPYADVFDWLKYADKIVFSNRSLKELIPVEIITEVYRTLNGLECKRPPPTTKKKH